MTSTSTGTRTTTPSSTATEEPRHGAPPVVPSSEDALLAGLERLRRQLRDQETELLRVQRERDHLHTARGVREASHHHADHQTTAPAGGEFVGESF
jgi:hypothetical protein